MENETWEATHTAQPDMEPSAAPQGSQIAARTPYVRQPVQRRTQEAIDDFAQNDLPSTSYTHDSNISVRGGGNGAGYRRSRNGMSRLQENNRYGQYLEMPKGQRSIFSSRNATRRKRSAAALVLVVVLLIAVALLVGWWMGRSGA